jgi:hypothetical protein
MRSSRRYLSGAASNVEKYHKERIDDMEQCCHPPLKAWMLAEQQMELWDRCPSFCDPG